MTTTTTSTKHFVSCPTCGTADHVVAEHKYEYFIYCANCYDCDCHSDGTYFSTSPMGRASTAEAAIDDWNEQALEGWFDTEAKDAEGPFYAVYGDDGYTELNGLNEFLIANRLDCYAEDVLRLMKAGETCVVGKGGATLFAITRKSEAPKPALELSRTKSALARYDALNEAAFALASATPDLKLTDVWAEVAAAEQAVKDAYAADSAHVNTPAQAALVGPSGPDGVWLRELVAKHSGPKEKLLERPDAYRAEVFE